jgi:hypothetical protein
MGKEKKIVSGRINLVQEERFRIMTESGRGYLLVLAHNSPATADDLHQWRRAGSRVCVEYEGEANMENGVAHRVWRARVAAGPSAFSVSGGGRSRLD